MGSFNELYVQRLDYFYEYVKNCYEGIQSDGKQKNVEKFIQKSPRLIPNPELTENYQCAYGRGTAAKDLRDFENVDGSAMPVDLFINLAQDYANGRYTHDEIKKVFSVNREILLSDVT